MAHRGVCRNDDALDFAYLHEIGQRIDKFILENVNDGDWLSFKSTACENELYVYVAHQRYRDPKLSLLTRAGCQPQPDESFILSYILVGRVLDHCTSCGLSKDLVQAHRSGIRLDVKVFTVRSVGSRADSAMRRVQTTGIRQELCLYDAAVHDKQTRAKKAGKDKLARHVPDNGEGASATPHLDPEPDPFDAGFNSLRTNLAKPAASNKSASKSAGLVKRDDPDVSKAVKDARILALEGLEVEVRDATPNSSDDKHDP